MIERLYGPPAFANTVNIRKTVDGPVGWYSPSTNELALRSLEGDVLIHELVHAFHDDFMLALASWEEGMARAIEVEVSKRVGIPSEQDHNYDYDVYY